MNNISTKDVRLQMRAYIDSLALNTALETGLFWKLAETPQTAEEVARALGIPPYRCGPWLALLVDMGYLEQKNDCFAPSPATQFAILDAFSPDTWFHLAEEERLRFPFGVDLARSMGHPLSVWAAQNRMPHDYLRLVAEDALFARRFTRMLFDLHQPLAEAVADTLDMRGVNRIMDLGGGSGVLSLALLRRYPTLTAVVVDHPHVCAAGRDIAAGLPEGERISYHAGDFLHDDLPGNCDLALECDVRVYNEALFRKVWCALNPGGRLVIVDDFNNPKRPPTRVFRRYEFYVSMTSFSPSTGHYSVSAVQSQLARAGFKLSVERNLPEGELMIQGQK